MKKTLTFFIFIVCIAGSAQAQITLVENDTTKVRLKSYLDFTHQGILYVLKSEDQDQQVLFSKNQDILKFIDVNDIESINVLKGESATNMYGPRAEQGAVVLHFKKGKFNKLHKDLIGVSLDGK